MATNFPNQIDTFINPVSSNPLSSPPHAQQHANANDAILAIQETLGVNPQGASATVGGRISAIESGSVSGSGADNQIAVWSGSASLDGSAALTFNGSTLGLTGGINVGTGGSTNLAISSSGHIQTYGATAPLDGQLLIGSTSLGRFEKASLTAGTNITITNESGKITINASGGGGGSVTSVGLNSGSTGLTVTSSTTNPITTSGTFTLGGTLGVANGGTGATSLAANSVLLGNGTSVLQTVAPSTSGNLLTSNGTSWVSSAPSGVRTVSAIGTTPNANGATVSGTSLSLQPASSSFGGVVTTANQTFAGEKTFNDGVVLTDVVSLLNTGELRLRYTPSSLLVSGNNNNFVFSGAYLGLRASGSGRVLTGLAGGFDGRILILFNNTSPSQTISITHLDSSSEARNQFQLIGSTTLSLQIGQHVIFIYASTLGSSGRWKQLTSAV